MNKYLEETQILDYKNQLIKNLIEEREWEALDDFNKIGEIYLYVRDEVQFGYNKSDDIQASQVLRDGYGQCNTKSTLLMALLRGVGIECRFHGFTIDKALQKGAISGIWYKLAPKSIVHSWVEVKFKDEWRNLEGVILDKKYLEKLQNKFSKSSNTFCGYGVYTDNFKNPSIDWKGEDTYIQKLGINQDFGIFDNPDEFYKKHQQALSPLKKLVFKYIASKLMNNNIKKIRNSK